MPRLNKNLNTLIIFSYTAIIVGILCSLFAQPIDFKNRIWDDAYMFVRYADNLLNTGQISWDPNGSPTFGLTSLSYWAIIVVPLRYFIDSASATAIFASFLSGCLFLILMGLMVIKHTLASSIGKQLMLLTLFILVTYPREAITTHFLSGMDTMFALAGLTVYILLSKWHERTLSLSSMCIVGAAGAILASVRPDLLLYSFVVPISILLFTQKAISRWYSVGILLTTIFLLMIMIGAATYYFNSPLPLPFYAKGIKLYGDTFYSIRRYDAFVHAKDFIAYNNILFSIIAIGIFYNYKNWWSGLTPVDRGILGAALLFFFYHLLLVTPVMGMASRFNYPLLPAVLFLGVRTFSIQYATLSEAKRAFQPYLSRPSLSYSLPFVLIFLFTPYLYQVRHLSRVPTYSFNIHTHYSTDIHNYYDSSGTVRWFGLDKFSKLPANLTIATTEIGLLAAMNPTKNIIDLAGLNDREIAHNGFVAESLLQIHRPDLIYLPHPHYKEMREGILNNAYFQQEYSHFAAQQLNMLMGVALHKKSPYYEDMLQIVRSHYEGESK